MAKTESDQPAEASGVDQIREELTKFLSKQVEHLAEKAGGN